MNNFDDRFKKTNDEIDRDERLITVAGCLMAILALCIALAPMAFVAWVVVSLMQHFGISKQCVMANRHNQT